MLKTVEENTVCALLLHLCFVRLIVSEVINLGHLATAFDVAKKIYNLNFRRKLIHIGFKSVEMFDSHVFLCSTTCRGGTGCQVVEAWP